MSTVCNNPNSTEANLEWNDKLGTSVYKSIIIIPQSMYYSNNNINIIYNGNIFSMYVHG